MVHIVQEAVWVPGPGWTGVENLAPNGILPLDRPTPSHIKERCDAKIDVFQI